MDNIKATILDLDDVYLLFFYDLLRDNDYKTGDRFCICNLLDIYEKYYSHRAIKWQIKDKIQMVFQGKEGLNKVGFFYELNKEEGIKAIENYAIKMDIEMNNSKVFNKIIMLCEHPRNGDLRDKIIMLLRELK